MKWTVNIQTFLCMRWQIFRNKKINKGIYISKYHSKKKKMLWASIPKVVTGIHISNTNLVSIAHVQSSGRRWGGGEGGISEQKIRAYTYISIPKYFCTAIADYCTWAIPFSDSQHFHHSLWVGALSKKTCIKTNQICICLVFDILIFKSACLYVCGWMKRRACVWWWGDAPKLEVC